MNNVIMQVEGTKLIITVDLTKEFGRSKTGKSSIVASTSGFTKLPTGNNLDDLNWGNVSVNLNVVKV